MTSLRAVIFDLGGTLIDWPDWDRDIYRRWALSYDYLTETLRKDDWPDREAYVRAMREAELAYWQRVSEEHCSNSPACLLRDGFHRLGKQVHDKEILEALNGYARAVNGWAVAFPDAYETLELLRVSGYRLGLLSNTWWAAKWHNADLVAQGLAPLIDEVAYTSDLPYSKPHPSVFLEMASRLGVEPDKCIMVGDRMIDDIFGALRVGMRAVWKKNDYPWPKPDFIIPTAMITCLIELPSLLRAW